MFNIKDPAEELMLWSICMLMNSHSGLGVEASSKHADEQMDAIKAKAMLLQAAAAPKEPPPPPPVDVGGIRGGRKGNH